MKEVRRPGETTNVPPGFENDEVFDNSELEWERYLNRDPLTGEERPVRRTSMKNEGR